MNRCVHTPTWEREWCTITVYFFAWRTHVPTTVIFLVQVLHLLDSLGLSQYKENFSKEKIDGALLMDLDSEILEFELMMESKLHRLKLMRVIAGKHCVSTPTASPTRLPAQNRPWLLLSPFMSCYYGSIVLLDHLVYMRVQFVSCLSFTLQRIPLVP